MPVLKEAAYYAALIKTNKYYFGFHSLIEAIGLSLEEGVELGKALKAEMNKRGLFSADHPADIEDALKSISNILATDPLWSAQAQAVNTLNSEFFSWGIRRLGRNYINAYRNKRKAKPEASETSDPDGKTESPPSKRARKATIALPVRLFANEVVYVRLPEGDMSIAAVDQFVDHSVETPDVSSVKPNSAGLQKFLHILSNLKTRPYVKGLHRVVCNLEGHVVRIDQNEGVFQAALVEMYERKVKKGLPMEFTISPISNTPRVTLGAVMS